LSRGSIRRLREPGRCREQEKNQTGLEHLSPR
jgi:hypothetical protein